MKNRKVSAGKNRAVTVGLSIALCYVMLAVVVFGTVLNRAPSEEVETETYIYKAEQYAIYHDTIPLRVEDLQAVDDCGYSYENYGRQATFLMAYAEAAQYPRRDAPPAPGLAYNVTTVRLPFLYDWCKRVLRGDVASHSGLPRPDSGSREGSRGNMSPPIRRRGARRRHIYCRTARKESSASCFAMTAIWCGFVLPGSGR